MKPRIRLRDQRSTPTEEESKPLNFANCGFVIFILTPFRRLPKKLIYVINKINLDTVRHPTKINLDHVTRRLTNFRPGQNQCRIFPGIAPRKRSSAVNNLSAP